MNRPMPTPPRQPRPAPRQAMRARPDSTRHEVKSGAAIGLMVLAVRPGGQYRGTSAGAVGALEMPGLLARHECAGVRP
ncbi:hypothetical protein [Komagataeibacter rhaeticus]|uniref:hypothetical protein n=1 Tax=Komagataeibacter rhaeticus TaxID=215221 RepID=UPI0039ED7C68